MTISTGYQSSHELSTKFWALRIKSHREWHQFTPSNVMWTILVALNEPDQQTKNFSLKGPNPTSATEAFLSLPQGCGTANTTSNCCWGHWSFQKWDSKPEYSTRPLGSSASTAVCTWRRSINIEHYYYIYYHCVYFGNIVPVNSL
jgi:hypothetical protein